MGSIYAVPTGGPRRSATNGLIQIEKCYVSWRDALPAVAIPGSDLLVLTMHPDLAASIVDAAPASAPIARDTDGGVQIWLRRPAAALRPRPGVWIEQGLCAVPEAAGGLRLLDPGRIGLLAAIKRGLHAPGPALVALIEGIDHPPVPPVESVASTNGVSEPYQEAAAGAIFDHIRSGELRDGFAARDIDWRGWGGVSNAAQVRVGLSLLVERGVLAAMVVRTVHDGGRGRSRAFTAYKINLELI